MNPKQRATELVEEGNSRHEAGDYRAAAELYSRALDIFPSPKIHFNLGETYRLLGHYSAAKTSFEQFLAGTEPKTGSKMQRAVAARIADMESRAGTLILTCAIEQAFFAIDGVPLEQLGTAVLLAPGEHQITARAEGYLALEQHVEVKTGQTQPIFVQLVPPERELARVVEPAPEPKLEPAPIAAVVETPPAIVEEDPSIFEEWWFWAAIVAAGATAAGAVAMSTGDPRASELGSSNISGWQR